jgi:hypothetical protein
VVVVPIEKIRAGEKAQFLNRQHGPTIDYMVKIDDNLPFNWIMNLFAI